MTIRHAMALVPAVLLLAATGVLATQVEYVDPRDLIFVTDDKTGWVAGCDAISVVDSRNGRKIASSKNRWSPGRLAVTSDGGLALAPFTNNERLIAGMEYQPGGGSGRWRSFYVPAGIVWGSPVAIAPDDSVVLLVMGGRIEKHRVNEIRDGFLRSPVGSVAATGVSDLVFAAAGRRAYVVTAGGDVAILDTVRMVYEGGPIDYEPVHTPAVRRIRNTFSALSPDGRYLVINTGVAKVNVVDLEARSSHVLDTPGLKKTYGLAFDYAAPDSARLAVHGHTAVALYTFRPNGLELLDLLAVPGQIWPETPIGQEFERVGALAWTGTGDGLVAAIGGVQEFRIINVLPGAEPQLESRLDFDACELRLTGAYGYQFDVVTTNKPGMAPPPTATAIATASMTPTTPRHTPTAPLTPRATVATTSTPTPSPTPTASGTPTRAPVPLYLPLALSERCDPEHKRADVALVIDTSSSMTGQKLEDAKSAAVMFVGLMDLAPGRDQVAVLRYDREAEVVCELSRARAVIEAAIRGLAPRNWTHIDAGLWTALAELQSPRHLERNIPVMILLTDGVQTGTPGEEVRAAAEVRAAGVRLYTIGLGADVDAATLREMASDDSRYHFAPASADLARIYAEIASDIVCPAPAGGFWPRR